MRLPLLASTMAHRHLTIRPAVSPCSVHGRTKSNWREREHVCGASAFGRIPRHGMIKPGLRGEVGMRVNTDCPNGSMARVASGRWQRSFDGKSDRGLKFVLLLIPRMTTMACWRRRRTVDLEDCRICISGHIASIDTPLPTDEPGRRIGRKSRRHGSYTLLGRTVTGREVSAQEVEVQAGDMSVSTTVCVFQGPIDGSPTWRLLLRQGSSLRGTWRPPTAPVLYIDHPPWLPTVHRNAGEAKHHRPMVEVSSR